MKRRLSLLAGIAALALVTTACTGGDDGGSPNGGDQSRPSIDPAQLRDDAATATAALATVRFAITVDGEVAGVAVTEAEGQLTRDGEVAGTAILTLTGSPTESEFVLIGDSLWLKGPTGGFQQLPASLVSSVFDPSAILDEQRGVPALLRGAQDPALSGTEEIDGTRTRVMTVRFASADVAVLLPGLGGSADLPGRLWVEEEDPHRLVRAEVGVAGGTVTITLSDFDAEADIDPPS